MKFNYLSSKKNEKIEYVRLLKYFGKRSRFYSDSDTPYLHYRIMENIFCKSFNAINLARSDISVDAMKEETGIGLKTFLNNNGLTLQKVAEFNKQSYLFDNNDISDIIFKVSEYRNKRLQFTKKIYDFDHMIYHLITRIPNKMLIFEEDMSFIDVNNIKDIEKRKNTISFTDGLNEYVFSLSKHTLFKRFDTIIDKALDIIEIDILEDPYQSIDFAKKEIIYQSNNDIIDAKATLYISENNKNEFSFVSENLDSIILPLYSPKSNEVQKKSGLNMWNAKGRKRDPDEVYFPIPSWIHKRFSNFFPYNNKIFPKTDSFKVWMPNRKQFMNMKVTQDGGKALQSNPNKDLGHWILRDVLNLPEKELVTMKMLDEIGIDSIILYKISDREFQIDFKESGSYLEFYNQINHK